MFKFPQSRSARASGFISSLLVLGAMVSPGAAQAQEDNDVTGFISAGAGIVPEFDGADSYQPVPFVVGQVNKGNLFLEFRGTQLRANVVPDDHFMAGPVVNFRFPRDSGVDSKVIALLPKVDTAIELGGFVGYRFGGDETGRGQTQLSLTVVRDVADAHDGTLVTGDISYAAVRTERFFLDLSASATYGNAKYTSAYFDVTQAGSTASKLPVYNAGSGMRDVGVGVAAGYMFSRRWGVLATLGYNRLLGDAKDSPIVDQEGSANQFIAGLGVLFRF